MTSIIIPAHNEEKVIERCLLPISPYIERDGIQVIVVCNGCTDKTANLVSRTSDRIICIETDTTSKANALNLGDEAAQSFPRFYIDADISISMEAIQATANSLEEGYLAALRDVQVVQGWLSDVVDELEVGAERIYADAGNMIYTMTVQARNKILLSARATVVARFCNGVDKS